MRTRTLWKWHSWLGLISGIPMIIIAVTGSILVFKHEIDMFLIPKEVTVKPRPDGRMDLDKLQAKIHQALPNYVLVGWVMHDAPSRSDEIYVIEKHTNTWEKTYFNGFTGEVLSPPKGLEAGFTDWMLSLHYTLLGGHLGMLIVGFLAIGLIGLGITGILIYKRFWIKFFTLKWGKGTRIFTGDLHRKLGMISAPVFLVLGITGAYWNITHAAADLYEHGLGEEQPVLLENKLQEEVSLDGLLASSRVAIPDYQLRYIAYPQDDEARLMFYGQVADQSSLRSPYGIIFNFDRQTGEPGEVFDIRESNIAYQTIDSFFPLHYGTFGGIFSRLLWMLLGLTPGVLAITGFVIYWLRTRKSKRKAKSDSIQKALVDEGVSIPLAS